MKNGIYTITKFTALDYPDHLSAIIWFAGCNMRCSYCYNPDIVFGKGKVSEEELFSFLESRIGLLEGVVLSGGECTLYDNIEEICKKIKSLGFKIKIDTNGTNPDTLISLIKQNLVDYIALDFKAPEYKFKEITGNKNFEMFLKSLIYLIDLKFKFEVRTTVHSDLLNEEDINWIINLLEKVGYNNTYYIQNFRDNSITIGELENQKRRINKDFFSEKFKIELRNF